jgi:hypothetical protein
MVEKDSRFCQVYPNGSMKIIKGHTKRDLIFWQISNLPNPLLMMPPMNARGAGTEGNSDFLQLRFVASAGRADEGRQKLGSRESTARNTWRLPASARAMISLARTRPKTEDRGRANLDDRVAGGDDLTADVLRRSSVESCLATRGSLFRSPVELLVQGLVYRSRWRISWPRWGRGFCNCNTQDSLDLVHVLAILRQLNPSTPFVFICLIFFCFTFNEIRSSTSRSIDSTGL